MIAAPWCSAGLPSVTLDTVTWLVVDTETTGLDPKVDVIREFAAIAADGAGRRLDTIVWSVGDGAGALDTSIAQAASWLERGAVFVAHNAGFDLAFLERVAGWTQPAAWLCTMRLCARRVRLGELAARLGITVEERHTALADARTLTSVMLELGDRATKRGVGTVAGLAVACPVVSGTRSAAPAASTWAGVRAALDVVVPARFVDAPTRSAFRSLVDAMDDAIGGPATPVEHDRLVTWLREVGITAAPLDLLLSELGMQSSANSGNTSVDT